VINHCVCLEYNSSFPVFIYCQTEKSIFSDENYWVTFDDKLQLLKFDYFFWDTGRQIVFDGIGLKKLFIYCDFFQDFWHKYDFTVGEFCFKSNCITYHPTGSLKEIRNEKNKKLKSKYVLFCKGILHSAIRISVMFGLSVAKLCFLAPSKILVTFHVEQINHQSLLKDHYLLIYKFFICFDSKIIKLVNLSQLKSDRIFNDSRINNAVQVSDSKYVSFCCLDYNSSDCEYEINAYQESEYDCNDDQIQLKFCSLRQNE
jgi:hypothetical protein